MTEIFDPAKMFAFYENVHGQLSAPGGREGVVIVRERHQTQTVAGVGCMDGQFQLRVHSSEQHKVRTRTLSATDYTDLIASIDRPEYKRIGGVSFHDVLDGESYLVKYIEPQGTLYVCLCNPRCVGSDNIAGFLKQVDRIIEMRL